MQNTIARTGDFIKLDSPYKKSLGLVLLVDEEIGKMEDSEKEENNKKRTIQDKKEENGKGRREYRACLSENF